VKFTASEIFHPTEMDVSATSVMLTRMTRRQFQRTLIREWRTHRRLTLEGLGGRVGMSASHLSMLENGARGYTQDTLERIARALATDPASLLGRNPAVAAPLWAIIECATAAQRLQIERLAGVVVESVTPRALHETAAEYQPSRRRAQGQNR
jgi:transcriptional regulator with XRE-family HTH domain